MNDLALVLVRQDSLGNIHYDSWPIRPNSGVNIPNVLEYKEVRYKPEDYPGGFKILLVEDYCWEDNDYSWLDDHRVIVWESWWTLTEKA